MKKILSLFAVCALVACGGCGARDGGISGEDVANFKNPPKDNYPETWFHFIGGNVSREGLTADMEAIARAKISGVQFFHGRGKGKWPQTGEEIQCLSPKWEGFVRFAAEEARRLGLKFSMQNCPGWSMSGGPWIEPKNAMRHIVCTRTDVDGAFDGALPLPKDLKPWSDYKDIAVLAFPTPLGDTGEYIKILSVSGSESADWNAFFKDAKRVDLKPSGASPHWFEVEIPRGAVVRTVEIPSTGAMTHDCVYAPRVKIKIDAILSGGEKVNLATREAKASNWQDSSYGGKILSATIACPEVEGAEKIRVEIENERPIRFHHARFSSAARKNSYESEAGWLLRAIDRGADGVRQPKRSYVELAKIADISGAMSANGALKWAPPSAGKWTILRIGHVNSGKRNGPAPAEATGWECDKLAAAPLEIHFDNYIGKLAGGALKGGLLHGVVVDSWECETQTWTPAMESEFEKFAGYKLRRFLPALFGYVLDDPEKTALFLLDWRGNIGGLLAKNYFGKMAQLAHGNNLNASFETAAGDVFPADIMEYYKFADTPMCEFWQPLAPNGVGSLNFKPIKPAAAAARLYGKKRLDAEAFTSLLSWDDHWGDLREVANVNLAEGVTRLVFHTYTHNPQVGFLGPGTSFGSRIGTPFLRGQTWWHLMPSFTEYFARNSYMLERGVPVADVLWYLGDEIRHKPDQNFPFPAGFKYDYCNRDILMNRLDVRGGRLVTPEGLEYKVLWLDDCARMRPETLEKILELVRKGATVVGDAPRGIATLSGGEGAQKRFDAALERLWRAAGENKIGLGRVVSGVEIGEFLQSNFAPRVKGDSLPLWLHRKAGGDDIFFVASPAGGAFKGAVLFRAGGASAEIWNAIDGSVSAVRAAPEGEYKRVRIDLPRAGSCFVVFRSGAENSSKEKSARTLAVLDKGWKLSFPEGWGAPKSIELDSLAPWKDLPISDEGRAFSGTATYLKTFSVEKIDPDAEYILDLGKVDMAAKVWLNGKEVGVAWCEPFALNLGDSLKSGANELRVEITSTWFNRLAYDAAQPESARKTWTITPPAATSPLRPNGLLGGVKLIEKKYRK